jgi:predicted peptidase
MQSGSVLPSTRAPFARLAILLAILFLLFFATGCASFSFEQANATAPAGRGFLKKSLTLDDQQYKYVIFIPHQESPPQGWPAVLSLHGLFEGGTSGTNHITQGLATHIANDPKNCRFIAIFPQSRGTWRGEHNDRLAMTALANTRRDYKVDPDRIVLSGFSYGGLGVWEIGARHKNTFAALIPMCPKPAFDRILDLTALPVWCFQNTGDPFVSASGAREMCERIEQAGGKATYTEYAVFGHDCWTAAWSDPRLTSWMLSQRRPATKEPAIQVADAPAIEVVNP